MSRKFSSFLVFASALDTLPNPKHCLDISGSFPLYWRSMLRSLGLFVLAFLVLIAGLLALNATVFTSRATPLPQVSFVAHEEYPDIVTQTTTYRDEKIALPVFDNPALNALIETDYQAFDSPVIDYEVLSLTGGYASFRFVTPTRTYLRTYAREAPVRLRLSDLLPPQIVISTFPNANLRTPTEYFGYQNQTLLVQNQDTTLAEVPLESIRQTLDLGNLELLAPEVAQTEAVARQEAELQEKLSIFIRTEQDLLETNTDCLVLACVALTFDDGPGRYTEELLDILRAKQAKATFYVLGQQVAKNPQTTKRIVADGHTLGNHTYHHPDLATLDPNEAFLEIGKTQQLIHELTGRYPLTYRPPFGSERSFEQYPLDQVLWSQDTLDWRVRNSESIAQRATENIEAGSIVLLHDTYPETVASVPQVIDTLRERGFVLVTVEDLLAGETYAPQSRTITRQ